MAPAPTPVARVISAPEIPSCADTVNVGINAPSILSFLCESLGSLDALIETYDRVAPPYGDCKWIRTLEGGLRHRADDDAKEPLDYRIEESQGSRAATSAASASRFRSSS